MAKKMITYCDKCGSKEGLELITPKPRCTCDYCGKTKGCNIVQDPKQVKAEQKAEKKKIKES